VNFKQFKYFKIDFQCIIIIVDPSSFVWFKNKTGAILGTLPEIPLMWGSQTTFQECNVASVIWDQNICGFRLEIAIHDEICKVTSGVLNNQLGKQYQWS
jgi:hypothetical protein